MATKKVNKKTASLKTKRRSSKDYEKEITSLSEEVSELNKKLEDITKRSDEDIKILKRKLRRRNRRADRELRVKMLGREMAVKRTASFRIGRILVKAFSKLSYRTIIWPFQITKEIYLIVLEKIIRV